MFINKFRKHTKLKKDDISEIVLKYYNQYEERYLYRVENFISNKEMIINYQKYLELEDKITDFNNDFYETTQSAGIIYEDENQKIKKLASGNSRILEKLIEDKVLIIDEVKVEIDKSCESTLKELIYFIKIQ